MRFRDRDVGLGIVLILFSCVGLGAMSTITARTTTSDVGPRAYPTILLIILIICGLSLIFQGVRRKEKKPAPKFNLKRVLPMVGLLLFYAFALDFIGFIAATLIFLVGAMLLLGERRPIPIIGISLVFSVGAYFLFTKLLMIALP